MSNGRFVLGVGAGHQSDEHAAVGVTLDRRIGRFEEAFSTLLELFDTGHAVLHGRHLDFEGWLMPRPAVRPRAELMVGSLAPRLLRGALPHVDVWNWDGFHYDVDDFRADWAKVRAVAEEVGRDPDTIRRSAHATASNDVSVEFRWVDYDAEAAAAEIDASDLPGEFAAQLREARGYSVALRA